jgi:DNA invertase Pin-like site-specific DNA recombinase
VRPRAFSYVRFSTPEQAKGASYERQIEGAQRYAQERGWELAETTYKDLGVSAFRHRNAQTGALRAFLKAVEDGDVPAGSYLLVENLDRLTREAILEAQSLFGLLISAGITIVTLMDRKEYSREGINSTPTDLILAIVLMMRGHEESATKSRRLADAYDRKRKRAAEGDTTQPFTRMLPAWIEWLKDKQRYALIPERAKVIETIFRLAGDGVGQHAIAQRLNAEGVPTFGGTHGKQRKADAWHRTYIKKILANPAVVGTFTPHQKRTDAQGRRERVPLDPVENYFPAVIGRELFERVASRARATGARGRNAAIEPKSVFAGLLRCAHCGGTVTRMPKGDNNVYLICSRANRRAGCDKYQAVRYDDVERALVENVSVIMEEAPRGKETEEIDAEAGNLDAVVSVIEDEARELVQELIREKTNAKRALLREKERELEQARERLRSLRAHRDTLASPYVARRLQALEQALTHKPLKVVEANQALKETVSHIVINPETAELKLYWHHAPDAPTDAGPFHSRHYTGFDAAKEPQGEAV